MHSIVRCSTVRLLMCGMILRAETRSSNQLPTLPRQKTHENTHLHSAAARERTRRLSPADRAVVRVLAPCLPAGPPAEVHGKLGCPAVQPRHHLVCLGGREGGGGFRVGVLGPDVVIDKEAEVRVVHLNHCRRVLRAATGSKLARWSHPTRLRRGVPDRTGEQEFDLVAENRDAVIDKFLIGRVCAGGLGLEPHSLAEQGRGRDRHLVPAIRCRVTLRWPVDELESMRKMAPKSPMVGVDESM